MFKGKRVSLVLPAYNEEKNISRAIDEFRETRVFDEIIVVDNNSRDKTSAIAKRKRVRVVGELRQGYGFALRRGIQEAKGYYIVLSEPDGTFDARDANLLLSKIDDFDMVTGTRTNSKFIRRGANMGFFLRLGNIAVARLIQLLYRTGPLTDCGCTFRVIKRRLVNKLLPHFKVGGQHFLAELVVLTALSRGRILEIPTYYQKRVGRSKITGSLMVSILVGLRMIGVILRQLVYKPKFN